MKMNRHDIKNYYNAVRNFMDAAKDFVAGITTEEFRKNPDKYNGLSVATSRLWHLQASYGMFKERQKDTDFHSIIREIYTECEKSGLTSGNLEKLRSLKEICFRAEKGGFPDKKIKVENQYLERLNRRAVLGVLLLCSFCLSVTVGIYFLETSEVLGKNEQDVVTLWFDVENVNLVQYSTRSYLTGYVYLKAPNGKRYKVENLELYSEAKGHVGQAVGLKVKRNYRVKKDGSKVNMHEEFIKPFEIEGFSGEKADVKNEIQNVEVQRTFIPFIVPF